MTLPPKIPSLPPLPLMASPDGNSQQQQQQQAWVPYEAAKDCSQGFCSIYCPQWCYIIFPPPPPFAFVDDDDSSSSGTAFSPLVIAIIGILASAFLLVTYYTIISKYCGGFRRRRPRRGPLSPDDPAADDDDGGDQDQSQRHETWHASASNGLDESLISKISVYKYRRGEGLIDGTDCSVCLGEFREDESLRLLPKCSHAFHVQCIDTWLRSHSNCPLCRANIVSVGPPLPPPQQQLPAPPLSSSETSHGEVEGERNQEAVVVIDDLEEETSSDSDGDGSKENSEGHGDNHHDIIEIRDGEGVQHFRRSFSMDSLQRGRVSIADILQQSMEDEFMVAKDQGLQSTGSGSSSRGREENSKGGERSRGLHCVMSPVSMKRSVSSGRFSSNRQGKGRNSVLPI